MKNKASSSAVLLSYCINSFCPRLQWTKKSHVFPSSHALGHPQTDRQMLSAPQGQLKPTPLLCTCSPCLPQTLSMSVWLQCSFTSYGGGRPWNLRCTQGTLSNKGHCHRWNVLPKSFVCWEFGSQIHGRGI